MRVQSASLPTLAEVRHHVLHVLCAHGQLDPHSTELKESIVERGRRPHGLFFQVQGPRLVKLTAIWSESDKRILFYDSTGCRFAETSVSASPPLSPHAA
jgi:hypothetical protein